MVSSSLTRGIQKQGALHISHLNKNHILITWTVPTMYPYLSTTWFLKHFKPENLIKCVMPLYGSDLKCFILLNKISGSKHSPPPFLKVESLKYAYHIFIVKYLVIHICKSLCGKSVKYAHPIFFVKCLTIHMYKV